MIELYRPVDCPTCADIEAALKEMVIAHKVITVTAGQPVEALPPNTALPALKDNGEVITGKSAIAAHLKVLQKFVEQWRMYQGDSCYIGEDGKVC